jgi:hypothetical protein
MNVKPDTGIKGYVDGPVPKLDLQTVQDKLQVVIPKKSSGDQEKAFSKLFYPTQLKIF